MDAFIDTILEKILGSHTFVQCGSMERDVQVERDGGGAIGIAGILLLSRLLVFTDLLGIRA